MAMATGVSWLNKAEQGKQTSTHKHQNCQLRVMEDPQLALFHWGGEEKVVGLE